MGLGTALTTFVANTVIGSNPMNTNLSNLNGGENPTFTSILQTAGTQETGVCGGLQITQVASVNVGFMTNFKRTMTNTPTSITLTPIAQSQDSGPSANQISTAGFLVFWKGTVAGGQTEYLATYTTNGN